MYLNSVELERSNPAGLEKPQISNWISGVFESARRDSNPRPRPWQGRAPPTEPLAHMSHFVTTQLYYHLYFGLSIIVFNFFGVMLHKKLMNALLTFLFWLARIKT